MNNTQFDSLLSDIGNSINRFARQLTSGSRLTLAFVITLALLLIGLIAVNVVLPAILAAIGALILFNAGKDGLHTAKVITERQEAQKDFEAVYLQTVCADLIQSMEQDGAVWTFDRITSYLAGENADCKTVLQACEELGWLKADYENKRAAATGKGITESREYLEWARINSAPSAT